jgi:ectoine hydroxylase-related dioxygenase (phytanoyl-CoA dioxygenase family)
MLKLSDRELREFGTRGYVIVRNVIPTATLTAASTEIDRLIRDQPPPAGYAGHHFYWLSTLAGGPLAALFNDTSVRSLAESLIDPGTIEIAFDQVQVALNIPSFSHRPGGHHLDGYLEDQPTPATFTMLAGVLMSEQMSENSGNLWVWPGTHRTHGAFFRERGPDALVEFKGYPKIELPEPVQILGGPGDVLLAHYMLGHNIGGNYASEKVRRAVYFRLRRVGHAQRWRECLCDELLEFDAVRVARGSDIGCADEIIRS